MMRPAADSFLQLPRRRVFSALELHAVAIGTIAAIVLIIGWGFNVEILKTLLPGFPPMRPQTAEAFMALSLSAMLSLRPSRRSQIGSSLIAAGVVIWMGWLLTANSGLQSSGSPAPLPVQATMTSMVLAGLAMLIVNLAPRAQAAAAILVWLASVPAMFRILSLLLFWGSPSSENSLLSSMALHTAALTVWFMMGCVLFHPRLSYAEAVFEASLRGRVLRFSLPFAIMAPVIAAVISLIGAHVFGWQDEALFAANAALSVIIGATLIWRMSLIIANWQADANERTNQLARANQTLEQYASAAAHDLKAPARHVMLYGELLSEALERGDIETARRHAGNIRDSAADLPTMIEGMLDVSSAAGPAPLLKEASLSELVATGSAPLAAEIRAARASVIVVDEARFACDQQMMVSVFQNLIANSLKSRRKDRALAIRIEAERNGAVWEISVEDNGVGFAPEFAGVAFNPLARGVARAGGGGVGLATCRALIQAHGGEIRVDPTFRDGARIEFTLPDRPGSNARLPLGH